MKKVLDLMTSDKALHFLYCYFLASIWVPLGIVFAIGKEVLDYQRYGKDMRFRDFVKLAVGDLIADGLGILCTVLVLGHGG